LAVPRRQRRLCLVRQLAVGDEAGQRSGSAGGIEAFGRRSTDMATC